VVSDPKADIKDTQTQDCHSSRPGNQFRFLRVFSLRALFVLVTTTAVVLGWIARELHVCRVQREAHGELSSDPAVACFGPYKSGEFYWRLFAKVMPRRVGLSELDFRGSLKRMSVSCAAKLDAIDRIDMSLAELADQDLSPFETSRTRVNILDLHGTRVGDTGIQYFSRLRTLNALDLGKCGGVRGLFLNKLEAVNLDSLVLDETSVTDEALSGLVRFPYLRRLYLAECQIGDNGLSFVSEHTSLEELDISGTHVTDTGLASLGPHNRIKCLGLSNCGVTDVGLARLRVLPMLEELWIDGIRTSCDYAAALQGFPSLRKLQIDLSQFTPSIQLQLALFTTLERLTIVDASVRLDEMDKLETTFPRVKFVFVAIGRADGQVGASPR
jgi:hypothetical protein